MARSTGPRPRSHLSSEGEAPVRRPEGKQEPFEGQAASAAPSITDDEQRTSEASGQGKGRLAAERNAGELPPISRPTDMLRFLGGIITRYEVGWNGPWPPPSRMGIAIGSKSGRTSVFEPTEAVLDLLRSAPSIAFTIYELRNASSLPGDFDSPYIFRGAEYVPEGESFQARVMRVDCTQFASCGWHGKRLVERLGEQPKPCPKCGKAVAA